VLSELTEAGYADLSLDRVARRAWIGRMSIYRRWPSKPALVAAAMRHTLPPIDSSPDTGRVRDDLLACFEQMTRLHTGFIWVAMQAMLDNPPSPAGNSLTALVRDQVVEPRLQLILNVLLKAAARGEIRAEAAVPVLARTGPALILQHTLLHGTHPPGPTSKTSSTWSSSPQRHNHPADAKTANPAVTPIRGSRSLASPARLTPAEAGRSRRGTAVTRGPASHASRGVAERRVGATLYDEATSWPRHAEHEPRSRLDNHALGDVSRP
jgi:AcrR family transcriptional regulator